MWNTSNPDIFSSRTFISRIPQGNVPLPPNLCVCIAYYRSERLVLRGLNLEVKAGQYVALVGASGCGKSTTVGLIERFYDPNSGQVIVDGVPVSEYNLSDYRKCISIVSQEPRFPRSPRTHV
jgi:ABC-type bacteriocin/lantibiotic exporter with double-glycine peptidase domain